MKKTIVNIGGMHCRSCELLVENRLTKVPGVSKVHASTKKQKVEIVSEDDIDLIEVSKAIKELGYETDITKELPVFSKDKEDYKLLLLSILSVATLYFIARIFNINSFIASSAGSNASLPVVFTLGITAGFSTCMAIVGGLVLGVSARFAEKHPNATRLEKFRPHLFFNLGRVISYTLLGGLIGLIGSAIRISTFGLGIITVIVGIYLLFVGLQIIDIFPKVSSLPTIPKSIARLLKVDNKSENEYTHRNSMILGALTFFLPCGFTQAMQLYAVSTGKFSSGALIMGVFALGTTPGLLGLGGLVSAIKEGYLGKLFFKFVGVTVIALSFYNVSTGLNLTGFNLNKISVAEEKAEIKQDSDSAGNLSNETQLIKSEYKADNGKISPDKFRVRAGRPVRFEVYAYDDGFGCMGSVMIPGLANEPKFFEKGKTAVLEFTPTRKGSYRITCAMGVPSGTLIVE